MADKYEKRILIIDLPADDFYRTPDITIWRGRMMHEYQPTYASAKRINRLANRCKYPAKFNLEMFIIILIFIKSR